MAEDNRQKAKPRPVVLVVEDEPILRLYAVDLVEEAGFEALEAADADAAIRVLEARSDVALLVTDVQMPGDMDGWKLAAYVRNRWPPIPIIVTSAFRAIAGSDLPERSRFIAKPFRSEQMISAIRELVAQSPLS